MLSGLEEEEEQPICSFSTAILGYSTRISSKKVPRYDWDNDRQSEIAIWPPKAEVLYLNSTWSRTPELLLELQRYLSQFQRYKYFRYGRPYCYFQLSVVFAIIWGHYPWTLHGWKPQNCRWNFDAIYRSSRDISISGSGDHIAISGCRSLLQSSEGTFFELVMFEKPLIVVGISTLSFIVPEI